MKKVFGIRMWLFMVMALGILSVPLFAAGSTEPGETVSKTDGPQYGGTLRVVYWGGEIPTADRTAGIWQTHQYSSPVVENLVEGDFETYGPKGTNQYDFPHWVVPEEFLMGALAESWDVTTDRITFKIRPGVYWGGREGVMEEQR